MIYQAF